jgi:uncharacterized protein YxjI
MAVLETIRVKFGIVITVLIAIALLSFIIDPTSLSMFRSDAAAQETKVASVNGYDVTYTEFSQKMNQYTQYYPYEVYEASVLKSNPELSTSEIKKIYNEEMCNMVMNDFLMEKHLVVKAEDAGFVVSDEEMYQLLSGQIFSNNIFSQFRGQMTPELLIEIESQTEMDTPEARSYKTWWNSVKESVKQERFITKYSTTFSKSLFSNPLLVEDKIQGSNNVFDVEFVMVPFDVAGDTTIVVSEQEVKDFYTAHQNLFPCIETRDLHYVVVEVEPETEDAEYEKLDSVLNNVNGIENFRKAAMDNGYVVDATPVAMYANTLGSVTGVENIIKWSFKEETGAVSDIYTIENNDNTYLVVAALGNITPEGYLPVEDLQVRMMIERTLYMEKAADKKLAEVNEKVNGLTDLKEIAKALGTQVSTKKNLTFASSDFDPIFTGAASVAEEGVVNAPIKGSNGIYVYKVANRSVGSFFTDSDMANKEAELNMKYSNMLQQVLTKEGNIKNSSYLYF